MQLEAKIEKTVTKTGTITLTMGLGEAVALVDVLRTVLETDLKNSVSPFFLSKAALSNKDFRSLADFRELLDKGTKAE